MEGGHPLPSSFATGTHGSEGLWQAGHAREHAVRTARIGVDSALQPGKKVCSPLRGRSYRIEAVGAIRGCVERP